MSDKYQIQESFVSLNNVDCFDTFQKMGDDTIDCIVADPPYAISFSNSHNEEEFSWDCFENSVAYEEFTTKWLNEAYRVLKPNGTLWCFYGITQIRSMFNAIDVTRFTYHLENSIVYARNKGRGASNKLKSLREDVFHLTKHPTDYVWNSAEYKRRVIAPYMMKDGTKRGWDSEDGVAKRWTGAGNVMAFTEMQLQRGAKSRGWIPDISTGEPLGFDGMPSDMMFTTPPYYLNKFEKQIHSCQKPILLLAMLEMISTNEGALIFDPFMGSGASGVATIITDRNYIGCEREIETYNKAKEWITHINYSESTEYIKDRISTSETGSKFAFGIRQFMPKNQSS
jgi:site-specific DNA-methyltransferase (adenine-specific)